ncbi:ankyrin repeat and sterile alpha motif domain-containing protein 1B isoform X2 [Drosophila grimshawi]|uniref:ankyrin repeat and sterile alpha motif domain-containing protein 1B isoform X2 n=1 Tax=Drosophila grimshawi TaxID=7222 RepID=UPI000C871327|nr:ankyrin repeat and sterile alpha motif domain-containing protein 1B isoform X2 [Drosophila grimshawi]
MGKDQHLLEAARNGDIVTVGKLLELTTKRHGPLSSFRRSVNINCQDVNGYTCLHHACLNGHSSIVRLILAHNVQVDVPDIRGSTPLFLASWAGHQDIVKMLLFNTPVAANPNAQTIENETPLHSGAQHGHNSVVAILLSYGADPTIRNNSFQTALDLAAQFGRLQVVQTLLRVAPDLIAPYRRFVENESSYEVLDYSNRYTATPTKLIFTHTCLHLASRNGHKKVVETLLAAGVDVNILTHAGSALHEAALCGKKSVVVALLKAGIDVHATDGNGRTALEILNDYPPHVTYEIVGVINEFTNLAESQLLRSNQTQLVNHSNNHINNHSNNSSNNNLVLENNGQSLPRRLFEKNAQRHKTSKHNDPARLRNSLDNYTRPPANYLDMKPVRPQKSFNDVHTLEPRVDQMWISYKPVYKQPYQSALLQDSNNFSNGSIPSRSYEYINLLKTTGSSSEEQSTTNSCSSASAPRQPIVNYVKMTLPDPSPSPIPAPRRHINADYANLLPDTSIDNNNNNNNSSNNNNNSSNNNNNSNSSNNLKIMRHSPTPDYPPPTVNEAETTIFNFMQPVLPRTLEESTTSFSSDQVEEFVGDMPFAGLFKGSTLNLAQDMVDGGRGASVARENLRSPSMVRSVNALNNQRRSLSKQRFSTTGEDFSASRVWAEIDTIFEHIGNEVSTVEYEQDGHEEEEQQQQEVEVEEEVEQVQEEPQRCPVVDPRQSLHIRSPVELLLGKAEESPASHWCHSPYTLVYGEIRYSVFYLGSTVIRQLQGTISTRKSIQKLKIDENFKPTASVSDISLLENCTTSTKYLKAANLQTRLKVDIAASCLGVKFIDHDTKTAICSHDIENINCVCQDAEDMRYFAYITKEQDLHYCHVFMVDNLELANEIILTLGQAFEVAYQLALSRQNTPLNLTEEC